MLVWKWIIKVLWFNFIINLELFIILKWYDIYFLKLRERKNIFLCFVMFNVFFLIREFLLFCGRYGDEDKWILMIVEYGDGVRLIVLKC